MWMNPCSRKPSFIFTPYSFHSFLCLVIAPSATDQYKKPAAIRGSGEAGVPRRISSHSVQYGLRIPPPLIQLSSIGKGALLPCQLNGTNAPKNFNGPLTRWWAAAHASLSNDAGYGGSLSEKPSSFTSIPPFSHEVMYFFASFKKINFILCHFWTFHSLVAHRTEVYLPKP